MQACVTADNAEQSVTKQYEVDKYMPNDSRTTLEDNDGNSVRMDDAHMAVSLFAERMAEDKKNGEGALYDANPDAQRLYFKGMHDVLKCAKEWTDMGLDQDTFAHFMELLFTQSAPTQTGPRH